MNRLYKIICALALLIILLSILYIKRISDPSTYHKKGCVGFSDYFSYKDHDWYLTGSPGIWNNPDDDPENDQENVFVLTLQNRAGEVLRIKRVIVEHPEGVQVRWKERGYNCESNEKGNVLSGCREVNVTEASIVTLFIEDLGARGELDILDSDIYKLYVAVSAPGFWMGPYEETAICSGRVNRSYPESIKPVN